MSKPSERVIHNLERRLREHVKKNWLGKVESLAVRSRGSFAYIDVQFSGEASEEEEGEQPLCRLRYLGRDDEWEFAYYSWSRGNNGGYEPSYLSNGQPFGTPEECFDCAAFVWQ